MAIPSSGQSLSFSALRTEFVGGSSAISLGDLYRGGCNILKKGCDITLETGVISLSACRYARKKPVKSTYFRGLTNKSIPDRIAHIN